MKHLRYLWYVLCHKWYVLVAGVRWTKAPLWRLLIHDWSKFLPSEWGPYVDFFYGPLGGRGRAVVDNEFDRAWLFHQRRNPHHWQYWVLLRDSGRERPLKMPDPIAREMVADWLALSGRRSVVGWYLGERRNMRLHPSTVFLVECLLHTREWCLSGDRERASAVASWWASAVRDRGTAAHQPTVWELERFEERLRNLVLERLASAPLGEDVLLQSDSGPDCLLYEASVGFIHPSRFPLKTKTLLPCEGGVLLARGRCAKYVDLKTGEPT
jgi:hypothetical protein